MMNNWIETRVTSHTIDSINNRKVWDALSGEELHTFNHGKIVKSVNFSRVNLLLLIISFHLYIYTPWTSQRCVPFIRYTSLHWCAFVLLSITFLIVSYRMTREYSQELKINCYVSLIWESLKRNHKSSKDILNLPKWRCGDQSQIRYWVEDKITLLGKYPYLFLFVYFLSFIIIIMNVICISSQSLSFSCYLCILIEFGMREHWRKLRTSLSNPISPMWISH